MGKSANNFEDWLFQGLRREIVGQYINSLDQIAAFSVVSIRPEFISQEY